MRFILLHNEKKVAVDHLWCAFRWSNGVPSTDYNFDGRGRLLIFLLSEDTHVSSLAAGEDFDKDLLLPNIDFGVYVSAS